MTALSIIRREHRDLGMTLLCFQSLLRDIERNRQPPDAVIFHAITGYIDSFLNRFHHPKEDDYLFPALQRCYPAAGSLIETLQNDHHNGIKFCERLRDTLQRYETGRTDFDEFHEKALDYIRYERLHVKKEETELLPLAEIHLEQSDWAPIDAAFSSNEDPMFGAARKNQFDQLSKLISNVCIYGDPLL